MSWQVGWFRMKRRKRRKRGSDGGAHTRIVRKQKQCTNRPSEIYVKDARHKVTWHAMYDTGCSHQGVSIHTQYYTQYCTVCTLYYILQVIRSYFTVIILARLYNFTTTSAANYSIPIQYLNYLIEHFISKIPLIINIFLYGKSLHCRWELFLFLFYTKRPKAVKFVYDILYAH